MPWIMMTTLKCQVPQASAAIQGVRTLETPAPTQDLKKSSLPKRRFPTLCYNDWDKPIDQQIASKTMFPREDTTDVGSVADPIGLTNVTSFLSHLRTPQSRNGVSCVNGTSPMRPRIAIEWEDSSKT